jgi:poly-gamma-glutamate capsule biosynthesis protein CapA/YwtB (metallophosphatase superfamily)
MNIAWYYERMKKLFFLAGLLSILLVSCQSSHPGLTLALLGDLMIGRGVDPAPDSLAYIAPGLQAADLSLANLESPLAELPPAAASGESYNLCAPASRSALLSAWGLDLLALANNHRFDCSPDGPAETTRLLNTLGLASIGPGMQPLYREIRGLKLAFLAFDDISAPLDEAAAMHAIQAARKQGAMVVVSVHWGAEYQAAATQRQKALAGQFAQAGAAVIVGTHPHVLQPGGWINTSRGKSLVLYSLGNALFDQPGLPDTRQSALLLVGLDAHGVQSVRVIPFEMDVVHSLIVQPAAATEHKIQQILNLP